MRDVVAAAGWAQICTNGLCPLILCAGNELYRMSRLPGIPVSYFGAGHVLFVLVKEVINIWLPILNNTILINLHDNVIAISIFFR